MRVRLAMYLGDTSILNLHQYLGGYQSALRIHWRCEEGVPRFCHFDSWLALAQGEPLSGGWARELLAVSKDNEEALDRFFNLAAEFGRLRVVDGETLELDAGHHRSEAYHRNNGEWPMPSRLQLMYLRPGESCYLRSWYGDDPQDDPYLRASVADVLRAVKWEYDIAPESWGLKPHPAKERP